MRGKTGEQPEGARRAWSWNKRIFVMLGCLVGLTVVMYFGLSAYVWINGRAEKEDGISAGAETDGDDAGDGVADVVSDAIVYSQEELSVQVEDARQQAMKEVLESIRSGLSQGDSVLETLRPFYPEDMIVYSGGKYHFVPINRSLKQSSLDEANLSILDTGEFQYLKDGEVISHKGIDVSKHQGDIDWSLVAQDGVEYAFIRVGYRGYGTGKMMEDEFFEDNIKEAIANGIKVGVYYYSQAITEEEVLEEAAFVLEKIAPYKIECPVVFDVERVTDAKGGRMNEITVEERTHFASVFCQAIQNAGYRPMIYHNTEMGIMMLDLAALEAYDKWFAAYSDKFYYPYEYKLWQYSQKGKIQGITGDVDLNISFAPLWEE